MSLRRLTAIAFVSCKDTVHHTSHRARSRCALGDARSFGSIRKQGIQIERDRLSTSVFILYQEEYIHVGSEQDK